MRPQPAQNVDEFDRAPVARLALQQGSAEHAEFFFEPAVDDVECDAALAHTVERDGELADHHRVPEAGMDGDQRTDVIEP